MGVDSERLAGRLLRRAAATQSVQNRERLVESGVLPSPGDGPSEERRAESWFAMRFNGQTADGRRLFTAVEGGDPGYNETAKMAAHAAMCVLLGEGDSKCGGVMTPATACGMALQQRLHSDGITFSASLSTPFSLPDHRA